MPGDETSTRGSVHGPVLAALGVAAALLGGCATSGGGSAASASGDAPDGRRLYLTCSGSCHSPEPVRDYSREEWLTILPDMIGEAKMPPDKARVLTDYVMGHF